MWTNNLYSKTMHFICNIHDLSKTTYNTPCRLILNRPFYTDPHMTVRTIRAWYGNPFPITGPLWGTGPSWRKSTRPCFYQSRSAWSVDQGPNKNHSPAYNFAPTVTQFCVMWEGLSLPHDTKFGNCRCTIVDSKAFPSWSLIHGLCWSGLIKAEPDVSGFPWQRASDTELWCFLCCWSQHIIEENSQVARDLR